MDNGKTASSSDRESQLVVLCFAFFLILFVEDGNALSLPAFFVLLFHMLLNYAFLPSNFFRYQFSGESTEIID